MYAEAYAVLERQRQKLPAWIAFYLYPNEHGGERGYYQVAQSASYPARQGHSHHQGTQAAVRRGYHRRRARFDPAVRYTLRYWMAEYRRRLAIERKDGDAQRAARGLLRWLRPHPPHAWSRRSQPRASQRHAQCRQDGKVAAMAGRRGYHLEGSPEPDEPRGRRTGQKAARAFRSTSTPSRAISAKNSSTTRLVRRTRIGDNSSVFNNGGDGNQCTTSTADPASGSGGTNPPEPRRDLPPGQRRHVSEAGPRDQHGVSRACGLGGSRSHPMDPQHDHRMARA